LKPIGDTFTNKTVDFHSGKVSEVSIEPLVMILKTVKVMGGEDWEMWIDALKGRKFISSWSDYSCLFTSDLIDRGCL
jgi:enoyl-[acyl-carrier protein] reductase/trans-2-enoyl-CoA reductase (NAD+)